MWGGWGFVGSSVKREMHRIYTKEHTLCLDDWTDIITLEEAIS